MGSQKCYSLKYQDGLEGEAALAKVSAMVRGTLPTPAGEPGRVAGSQGGVSHGRTSA